MTTINDKIKNGEVYRLQDIPTNKDLKVIKTKSEDDCLKIGKNNYFSSDYLVDKLNIEKSDATIESVCDALKEFLLAKNKNYGNSATEPVRVFSKSNANEGILVRMDDKLSRIKNSDSPALNDTVDLLGYLVLLCKNNNWDDFKGMID